MQYNKRDNMCWCFEKKCYELKS